MKLYLSGSDFEVDFTVTGPLRRLNSEHVPVKCPEAVFLAHLAVTFYDSATKAREDGYNGIADAIMQDVRDLWKAGEELAPDRSLV